MNLKNIIRTAPLELLRGEVERRTKPMQPLIQRVADTWGVRIDELLGKESRHHLTAPRVMLAHLLAKRGIETAGIADLFGAKQDTVRKWVKKHEALTGNKQYKTKLTKFKS